MFMARAKNPREVELVLIKGRGIEVGAVIDYRFYGRHNFFEEVGRSDRTHAYSQNEQESQTERKRVR